MSYRIISNPSIVSLIRQASDQLHYFLTNEDVLLLLSGGSAFQILEKVNMTLLGPHLTISVLDERFSNNPSVNNFSQLTQTLFFIETEKNNCHFIDTRPLENETIYQLASRYEHSLRNWKTAHPNGKIVATQGIGPDGHTAGIMPYPENPELFHTLFENEDRWIVGYDAQNKNEFPLRITATIPFLKMIDYSVVLVLGDSKKNIIEKALHTETKINEIPAKIIQDMKEVFLFTDQEISNSINTGK